ncbi:hypothetical protein F0562_010577 [Nyssa sinensis]|uniref:AAA+ ATPase domain-containing protein n=1 Tax=Nyssa sinensis TaxID=561372 RepID=A0A5J5A2I4_9ASTE|nr:hypothetical protein F0562_010577 [Nyssa sinensis]
MVPQKSMLSAIASITASAMLIRSVLNDFLPREIQNYLFSGFRHISHHFSSQFTILIEEFQGLSINHVFEAADIYLGSRVTPSAQRVRLGKVEKDKNVAFTMDRNEEIVDVFQNVQVKWRLICTQVGSAGFRPPGNLNASVRSEINSYELTFHKKHKQKVLDLYLPYILQRSKAITEENKATKLHTVYYGRWNSNQINLHHPMTFKSLAMDSELKKALMEDLDNFIRGKDFYRRIGKAWKRGYLLHGPPGTGKSSLIAAMANYLNFDIYDLDLTDVHSNSDLRSLQVGMSSRSILVIEDIDCTIKLENRELEDEPENGQNKVRFFHIAIHGHPQGLLREVKVTPAEVAGELMKSTDVEVSLHGLVKFLHKKITEGDKVTTNMNREGENGEGEKEIKHSIHHGRGGRRGMRGGRVRIVTSYHHQM